MATRQALDDVPVATDMCPFPRPFPEEFTGCPAYQPSRYVGLDMMFEPVATVWTCTHLEPGSAARGAFYARCRLGDAGARRAWAARLSEERLVAMRPLQLELGRISELLAREMWSAKARQVAAGAIDRPDAPETQSLRDAGSRFLSLADTWLRNNEEALSALGFPSPACHRLFVEVIESWIAAATMEVPSVSSETLAAFPAEVRSLLLRDPSG